MSYTLKADNRQLIINREFSYLSQNYNSGETNFVISNVNNFSANDYVLIGEIGVEGTEILKIQTVTSATKTITTTAASTFAHAESTKITVINYNQVRFYWSSSATDTTPDILSGYTDIEPDDFYTKYYDTVKTSGYGFFLFYNATTLKATAFSNPIPYADFGVTTVQQIFNSFFSLLNNKEAKLISYDDAYSWLNEGYVMARNQFNIVSESYHVPDPSTITTTSGTAEYDLPSDFSRVVSLTDEDGEVISKLNMSAMATTRDLLSGSTNDTQYYLRNTKIGFVPTPTSAVAYTLYYKAKTTILNSLEDTVDFPNNDFYFLVDFMMYRAAIKIPRANPESYLKIFQNRLDLMKIAGHKQDDNLDSWGIAAEANV